MTHASEGGQRQIGHAVFIHMREKRERLIERVGVSKRARLGELPYSVMSSYSVSSSIGGGGITLLFELPLLEEEEEEAAGGKGGGVEVVGFEGRWVLLTLGSIWTLGRFLGSDEGGLVEWERSFIEEEEEEEADAWVGVGRGGWLGDMVKWKVDGLSYLTPRLPRKFYKDNITQPNTLPKLFRTIPSTTCPPNEPIPNISPIPPETELAHLDFASLSAYVNPRTFDRLNTSAKATIGRNLDPFIQPLDQFAVDVGYF